MHTIVQVKKFKKYKAAQNNYYIELDFGVLEFVLLEFCYLYMEVNRLMDLT